MGRLMSRFNPLEISGRRVGLTFVGQQGPRPFPFETHGPVWPAMRVGPGPKVPTHAIIEEKKLLVLNAIKFLHIIKNKE